MLTKAVILDQIKKSGSAILQSEEEVEFFRRTFELVGEYDFEGLQELAQSHGEGLKPFFEGLEESAAEWLVKDLPANCFLFYLLQRIFAGDKNAAPIEDFSAGQTLDLNKILELYRLFSCRPFGQNETQRLRVRMHEWKLDRLCDWAWEKGLTLLLNERYRQLKKIQESALTIPELNAEIQLSKLFNTSELVDNFVFDNLRHSSSATGVQTDLFVEKKFRKLAVELRDHLVIALDSRPINFGYLKKAMLDLRMKREVEFIEGHGIHAFKELLDRNLTLGARETARIFGLVFNEPSGSETLDAPGQVNHSFLLQARQSASGRKFLHREALLGHPTLCEESAAYVLREGFVVVRYLQEEGLEHVLVAQFNSPLEREKFIARCLVSFYRAGNPRKAGREIVGVYLKFLSPSVRVRKSVHATLVALPVITLVSGMLTWLYEYTMNDLGGGLILGAIILLLGTSITARNGYMQKVMPEENEQIPGYLVLQHDRVTKIAGDEIEPVPENPGQIHPGPEPL